MQVETKELNGKVLIVGDASTYKLCFAALLCAESRLYEAADARQKKIFRAIRSSLKSVHYNLGP